MAAEVGIYSPSEDSEGPLLRDFVNETIARQNSPRSELLSGTNGATTPPGPRRGPSKRYRTEREMAYRGMDSGHLLSLLIDHEYEASKMRKTLYMILVQKEAETQRATEAERQAKSLSDHVRGMNERHIAAERESHTLEEELTLYKIQYDLAQKEILKARETVLATQTQLDAAEQEARKARGDARKVKEAMEIWKAREEGRKLGFEAGWNRAREEFGIVSSQPPALEYEPEPPEPGDVDEDTISYRTYPPPNSRTLQFSEVPIVQAPPPPPPPAPAPILRRSPPMPEPEPVTHSRPPTRLAMATPAVQEYPLPIPAPEQVNFDNRPPSPIRRANSRKQPPGQPWQPPIQYQRSPSPRPPDNYIPALSDDGHIALPAPHELSQHPPSPGPSVNASLAPEPPHREYTSAKGKARATDSWYNQNGEVDSRTHIPSNQPEASTPASWYQQPRPDSERNRRASMSSRYSANSSGGLLDAWGVPIQEEPKRSAGIGSTLKNMFRGKGSTGRDRDRDRALSMIKEDPLSRQGSLNVGPPLAPPVFPPSQQNNHPTVDSNQRFADELRYDNPDIVERQRERRPPQDLQPRFDRPPRNVRMPARITVPGLLSPPQQQQHSSSRGHLDMVERCLWDLLQVQGSMEEDRNGEILLLRDMVDLEDALPWWNVLQVLRCRYLFSLRCTCWTEQRDEDMDRGPQLNDTLARIILLCSYQDPVQRPRSASLNYGSPSVRRESPPDWARAPLDRARPNSSNTRPKTPNTRPSSRAAEAYPSYQQRPTTPSAASSNHQQRTRNSLNPNNPYPSTSSNTHGSPNSFRAQGLTCIRTSTLRVYDAPLPNPHRRAGSAEGGASVEPSPLKRVQSNVSMKSMGSQYSHFDPETYTDPAYYALDGTDPGYRPTSRGESRSSRR
ncbi:hypothetical protein BT96DRAFT_937954 [Gymnopus androsaceus JB14]|uniref:Uncharacterized protein n=1 Tax=Gymnopus androsaceus JB14 TaxID=1447944 RepID=A0A6A4HUB4_9AGAR|nr:hypothetical protein BT96DRAFT_937954 [Gymnopus androsaceus JB14]